MKKNSFKRAFSALAIAAVAASASSMAAFADEANGYDQTEIDASATKPTVFISVDGTQGGKVFDTSVAGQTVEVTLNVTGAQQKYASTGFHIYYDSRLDIPKNPIGLPDIKAGGALEYISPGTPEIDPTAADQGMEGFFVASAGSGNNGVDGVLWTFKVTVPADAKAGDVFPIDVIYKSNKNAEDLFVNTEVDKAGELMQAYVFTKGIYNKTTNNNFAAAAADVEKCAALADVAKDMDGYIAIAGGTTETSSATTEATTTEATTTEATTTEAATTASATASTSAGSTTAGSTTAKSTTSTAKGSTTKAGTGTTKNPKTGVSGTGAGLAVAGLAVAVATAFVLRKKED